MDLRKMYACTQPAPDASVLEYSEVAGGACFCSLLFKLHGPGLDTLCTVTTSSTMKREPFIACMQFQIRLALRP